MLPHLIDSHNLTCQNRKLRIVVFDVFQTLMNVKLDKLHVLMIAKTVQVPSPASVTLDMNSALMAGSVTVRNLENTHGWRLGRFRSSLRSYGLSGSCILSDRH